MNIANKTVLITGANRGVGRALVDEALKRGARRVLAATRTPFSHPDPRVTPLALDVTDQAQIQRAAAEIEGLDVLINNAGISVPGQVDDIDLISRHLTVNCIGSLQVTHALLPKLVRARGAVVNVLSLASLAPIPFLSAYSISKAAALSMTQSLRAVLKAKGVTVHGVLLGPTDTDMNRGFDIPKAPPDAVARGILDGLAAGEEEIFPDPMSSTIAAGWRAGVAKAFEQQNASFLPASEPVSA